MINVSYEKGGYQSRLFINNSSRAAPLCWDGECVWQMAILAIDTNTQLLPGSRRCFFSGIHTLLLETCQHWTWSHLDILFWGMLLFNPLDFNTILCEPTRAALSAMFKTIKHCQNSLFYHKDKLWVEQMSVISSTITITWLHLTWLKKRLHQEKRTEDTVLDLRRGWKSRDPSNDIVIQGPNR